MSTPFKMKGWSGSPIRQNPKVSIQTSLANIQTRISNTLKGIGTNVRKHVKPQSSSSGFGLTSLEKAQAKKSGMSQWQWKTDRNKSGTRANRYARDNKLGKYALKEKDSIDTTEAQAKTDIIKPQEISIVTDGKVTGKTSTSSRPGGSDYVTEEFDPTAKKSTPTDDWITRKGDPWSYKKTDKGYQTKKGEDGTVIDVFNKNSTAYQSIAEKVDFGSESEDYNFTENTGPYSYNKDRSLRTVNEGYEMHGDETVGQIQYHKGGGNWVAQ